MNTTHRPNSAFGTFGTFGSTRALVISACLSGCLIAGCAGEKPVPDPAEPSSAVVLPGFYRVNQGDTLATIAAAFGRDAASLARWNGLPETVQLPPGKVLRVAPPPADGNPPRIPPPRAAANSATCGATGLSWPVSGNVLTAFDGRKAPGISIGGKPGDTVKAARSGRVVYTGSSIEGYGLLIIVKHDEHFLAAYGFNERVLVKEGDKVKRGQALAQMGKAALLFEVRMDGKPVDPLPYLKQCDS